jgi:hypothetical protein
MFVEGLVMARFYVLPPRSFLASCFSRYLETLLPGLDDGDSTGHHLAESLLASASTRTSFYLIHREELPAGEDLERALADGYGAEAGDEIVEVRAGSRVGDVSTRRWQMSA